MVSFALAGIGGCFTSALNAYGLEARIVDAKETPLGPAEVEELRAIAREIAKEEHLVELEDWKGEEPGDEIFDGYIVLHTPSREVILSVEKDRRHAHIQVRDWQSAGNPNEWTRNVTERVRTELTERLPNRSVEVEAVDLGFWGP